MKVGLVGKKAGMTTCFNDDGSADSVTIIEVVPNRVVQYKTIETDGYSAVQVAVGHKKDKTAGFNTVNKSIRGHYASSGVELGEKLVEIRVDSETLSSIQGLAGSNDDQEAASSCAELSLSNLDCYQPGALVDVTGTSKGKGFAGVVKRHHFKMQDATHGNSLSHRAPGSIGQCQTPGRVFKGKKMAGQMGNVKRTIQQLKVVKVDQEKNLIFVKGSVPGKNGGYVKIQPSVKVLEKDSK
jgi:large subunit ribosomal protein L3